MPDPIVTRKEVAFSPLNKVIWMKAFIKKAKKVTLVDGREFKLKYGKFSRHEPHVWFEPIGGKFAPCGYLRMSIVTDPLWLEESDRPELPDGKYVVMLDEFIESDLQGVEVKDNWAGLHGKLKATLQRGFAQAKTQRGKAADHVQVVMRGEEVFLLKGNGSGS